MTTSDFIGTGLLVVSTVFLTALPARAQGAAATYTAAEADRGAAVYAEQCAQCHGSALSDGSAPALLGPTFRRTWSRPQVTVNDLYYIISTTMPPNRPGSLLEAQYREVLAHLMAENGMAAGAEPVPTEQRLLETISLLQPDDVALGTATALITGTRGFPQGTGPSVEDLVAASDNGSDWLFHTRDFSGTRYSPLSEIMSILDSPPRWTAPSGARKTTATKKIRLYVVNVLFFIRKLLTTRTGLDDGRYLKPEIPNLSEGLGANDGRNALVRA